MVSIAGQADENDTSSLTPLTFLIADIRGYTRFAHQHGDEAAARLADQFAALAEEVLGPHGGHVLELRGDEALAVFRSARDALRGAVALQASFQRSTRDDPSLPLAVGMGVDSGEAVPVRGGYRGRALNVAARLCSIAGSGDILVSEGVVHLAGRTEGLAFVDRGQVTLKGLSTPVHVLQIGAEGEVPEELPPLQPTLVTHPTNLPNEPTPFVGREGETAAVTALLRDPHIRLVTLTGPGGTGKTRLALHVGATLLYDFSDGVFFCDLGPLTDPSLVLSAIAQALEITEEASRSLAETLVEWLKEKQVLLLLDNFEHLLDGCHAVGQLLDACRHLHVLVTSRIPLHLTREHEHAVPPLAVPDLPFAHDAATLAQYDSVALFIQRARAAKDSFAMTDENAPALAAICARLDGLPLAVELAAVRIKLFPPEALLQRLDSRLQLLTGGARDKPSRQQTLRGTIDWSYSLLTDGEQDLFAQLSVFAGGWSFEAAEAVCVPAGDLDLIDGLSSLVDKSLVRQEGEEGPRFSMLETIREYAAERLAARHDAAAFRDHHAAYFLSLAHEAQLHMLDSAQQTWLQRLATEQANLRVALDYLFGTRQLNKAGQLASALWIFWWNFGQLSEGRKRLHEVLFSPDVGAVTHARCLTGAAYLAMLQGDTDEASRLFEESITCCRALEDKRELARALTWAVDLPLFHTGRHDQAALLIEESIAHARAVDDRWALVMATANQGVIAGSAGDPDRARQLYTAALTGLHAVGDVTRVAWLTAVLATLDLTQGAFAQAQTRYHNALRLARDLGHVQGMLETLDCSACVRACLDRFDEAAALWGAVDALRERFGISEHLGQLPERSIVEKWRMETKIHLGDQAWERATARGRPLSLDQAVMLALQAEE